MSCGRPGPRVFRRALAFLLVAGTVLPASGRAAEDGDTAFLDDVSRRTFSWFLETTEPSKGLTPVRAPRAPAATIAAIGGALTAWGIGAERGYVTREQAAERTLATLDFLYHAPQGNAPRGMAGHRGFFYHLLNMDDGLRHKSTELSTMDTALLMAGVLFAQSYFDAPIEREMRIRRLAESLYRRVDWRWFLRDQAPLVTMSWRPDGQGFSKSAYRGLNEAMILYVLALGSPTHAIGADSWDAYSSSYVWGDFRGFEHVQFSPLFGHQYSHMWIDFRGIADAYMRAKGIDYFENSRRATLAQKAYALDNPGAFDGYGENLWGLTACDGPANATATIDGREVRFRRYWPRGASLRFVNDDGTIAPTAAGGSIPFAPRETIPVLREIVARFGDRMYDEHGFLDAFNPTFARSGLAPGHGNVDRDAWFDDQHLGINQAPILIMIENHRSGFVWETMKKNPHLVRGLCRAGFRGGWLDGRCEQQRSSTPAFQVLSSGRFSRFRAPRRVSP